MKEGWYMIVLAATFTVVATEVILPIPTECPLDSSSEDVVHIAHETDCTKFYKCDGGEKIEKQCPPMKKGTRLHFNPREQVCDWPSRAGCKPGGSSHKPKSTPTPTIKPKSTPTPAPLTTTTSKSDIDHDSDSACADEDTKRVTYPHPCSCEKYYICKAGDLILRNCPAGYHWNERKEMCDKPAKANCIRKKTAEWYYY